MQVFDPVLLSIDENRFLLEHLVESPFAVFRTPLPKGVNAAAVRPVLSVVYELESLKEKQGTTWVGIEALKDAIALYLKALEEWQEVHRRGGPTFPTMYGWDHRGKPHRHAVGADGGHVRTYLDFKTGERRRFAVELESMTPEFVAPWTKPDPTPLELIERPDDGVVECPLCHKTETYESGVQTSRNMAMVRMANHLKGSKKDPERHRELGTAVFGS